MTRYEFLMKTYNRYHNNPNGRAINNEGFCVYRAENGNKCAIGWELPDELYFPEMDKKLQSWDGAEVAELCPNLEPFLLEANGRGFIYAVQSFHDCTYNWNEKGITEEGEKHFYMIVNKYIL